MKKTKTTKPAPKATAAPSPKTAPKPARVPRKTAADLMSDEESDGGWDKLAEKNAKSSKGKKGDKKKEKKAKPAKEPTPEPVEEDEIAIDDESVQLEGEKSESEEEDDQTSNLLQGFESSDDEMDGDVEEVDGKKIVKSGIPNAEKVKKQLKSLSGREKVCYPLLFTTLHLVFRFVRIAHAPDLQLHNDDLKNRLVFMTPTWIQTFYTLIFATLHAFYFILQSIDGGC